MVLMRTAWVLAMLAVTVLAFCRMGRSGGRSGGRCGGGGLGLGVMEKSSRGQRQVMGIQIGPNTACEHIG